MRFFPEEGLPRIRYVLAGAFFMALKIGLDLAVSKAFGKPYSILVYLSPSDSPLFSLQEEFFYWWLLWAVTLPFIAIGVGLTVLRLRNAGLTPWLALFFFAPWFNIMLFIFCSLVPAHDGAVPPPHRAGPTVHRHAMIKAALTGAILGVASMGLGVLLLESYGVTLFIGAPPICGFVSSCLYVRWAAPATLAGAVTTSMVSLLMGGGAILFFAFEGIVCLMMALPLVLTGSLIGCLIGYLSLMMGARGRAPTITALALLPLSFTLEAIAPFPLSDPAPVESSIVIHAPAEEVWRHVIAFPSLPPPTEWIFHAGIAAPVGATIDGEGAGAIRRCRFTTGDFIEPIEIWDPPRELTFGVTASPDPMRELTLWRGPRPPHLDGLLESTRGQFLLEPLPEGRTRLTGRTWYRTNMVPEVYWRLWADPIIHAIHMRVLRHVAALASPAEEM